MKSQHGFGAIMAIVVLVILASLAAAMVKFSTTQQLTSAQDVLSARALAAARAGNEWGLFQALKGISGCLGATGTLDLRAATGFKVTVSCFSPPIYNEGGQSIRIYQITSTACNSSASCPDAAMATSPGYIERTRQVIVAK